MTRKKIGDGVAPSPTVALRRHLWLSPRALTIRARYTIHADGFLRLIDDASRGRPALPAPLQLWHVFAPKVAWLLQLSQQPQDLPQAVLAATAATASIAAVAAARPPSASAQADTIFNPRPTAAKAATTEAAAATAAAAAAAAATAAATAAIPSPSPPPSPPPRPSPPPPPPPPSPPPPPPPLCAAALQDRTVVAAVATAADIPSKRAQR